MLFKIYRIYYNINYPNDIKLYTEQITITPHSREPKDNKKSFLEFFIYKLNNLLLNI